MREKKPLEMEFGPCCFCGAPIAVTDVDPCTLTVSTVTGEWQTWLSHAVCFRKSLAARDDDLSEPIHF